MNITWWVYPPGSTLPGGSETFVDDVLDINQLSVSAEGRVLEYSCRLKSVPATAENRVVGS